MRTRTLLLLAIGCGIAILVAGMFLLLKLDRQTAVTLLAEGDTGRAGDAVVRLQDASIVGTSMVANVTLSGVDDPAGIDGFALVVKGSVLRPSGQAADACAQFTVAPTNCTLTFPGVVPEGDHVLLFSRAAEKVRWKLVP
jgi:hypothetical protein